MMARLWLRTGLFAGTILICEGAGAHAQSLNLCVREHIAEHRHQNSAGIAASDAENLIRQVARSIGIGSAASNLDFVVVSCHFAQKAHAYYADGTAVGVPQGEYIIYNPTWVQEVIGTDRVQAIALFGHEIGHFIQRHFTSRRQLTLEQKETEADRFAGCAVARLGGAWAALQNLLGRLRNEVDAVYPTRLKSIEAAREGFVQCGGSDVQASSAAKAFADELTFRFGVTIGQRASHGQQIPGEWTMSGAAGNVIYTMRRDFPSPGGEKISLVATSRSIEGPVISIRLHYNAAVLAAEPEVVLNSGTALDQLYRSARAKAGYRAEIQYSVERTTEHRRDGVDTILNQFKSTSERDTGIQVRYTAASSVSTLRRPGGYAGRMGEMIVIVQDWPN